MSTPHSAERYPTVRQGYDPTLVESDLAAMERTHQSVVEDAAAKIAALEKALEISNSRNGAGASGDAEEIVAAARKEAFQLITEARKEAGLVISEARTEVAETLQLEPEVTPPDVGGADALQAEELRLEARIVELQATLAGLESGIRSLTGMLASGNPPAVVDTPVAPPPIEQPAHPPIALEGESTPTLPDISTNGGEALVEPLLPPQRNYSAPPPPPPQEPEPAAAVLVEDLTVEVADEHEQAPAPDGGLRASFYSRRSAQLPHIGADAGRDAITAATDLRASMGQKTPKTES